MRTDQPCLTSSTIREKFLQKPSIGRVERFLTCYWPFTELLLSKRSWNPFHSRCLKADKSNAARLDLNLRIAHSQPFSDSPEQRDFLLACMARTWLTQLAKFVPRGRKMTKLPIPFFRDCALHEHRKPSSLPSHAFSYLIVTIVTPSPPSFRSPGRVPAT